MSLNHKAFSANELILVAAGESFHDPREPPLGIGSRVRLNSGSPDMLVVEIDGDNATVAYLDDAGCAHEYTLPAVCFHRIRE